MSQGLAAQNPVSPRAPRSRAAWAAPAALFLVLAGCVLAGLTVSVDHAVHARMHAAGSPTGVSLMRALTALGSVGGMSVVTLLVAAWLYRRKAARELRVWMLAMVGCLGWVFGLKALAQRPRPSAGWIVESGFSFPSGHAMSTATATVTLGYVLWSLTGKRASTAWLAAQWALVLLLMTTRVYLGVHYLSDVLAGGLLGLAWARLCAGKLAPSETPAAPAS